MGDMKHWGMAEIACVLCGEVLAIGLGALIGYGLLLFYECVRGE